MRRPRLALAAIGASAALAACSDPAPSGNPATVWLFLDGDERHVQLVDHEPPPY